MWNASMWRCCINSEAHPAVMGVDLFLRPFRTPADKAEEVCDLD
jgi:hypothetical protein